MTANPNLASDQKPLGNRGASTDDDAKSGNLADNPNPYSQTMAR
jgi:hypothetical protein